MLCDIMLCDIRCLTFITQFDSSYLIFDADQQGLGDCNAACGPSFVKHAVCSEECRVSWISVRGDDSDDGTGYELIDPPFVGCLCTCLQGPCVYCVNCLLIR